MAGAGAKLFTSGSVLTADQVNTFLMDQSIMRFTSTTTRDAAFGGAGEPVLAEGMFAYTTDTNTLWLYNGSSWVNLLGSDIGEQALSNRNVVINGAMQVAQRGTSTASITVGGYYTADRMAFLPNSMGTWTQSVENDAPTGSGLRKSWKVLCTTADASPAAGDFILIQQSLEGQNVQQFLKGTASAKPFAFSFWVKSNVTGTYIVELFDNNNTRQVSASYTVSVSGTWEKKTIIFPADTTGAFNNDNASSLGVNFFLGAGSNFTSGTLNTTWNANTSTNRAVGVTNLAAATSNYWQVTGIQLEAGSVATPFEFEDYGTTLGKCQRYYTRYQSGGIANAPFGLGIAASTTTAAINVQLPVTMRVAPTSIDLSALASLRLTENVVAFTPTAVTLGASDTAPQIATVVVTTTGLTQYRNYFFQSNGTSGYVGFSAEL
jgi:hypothetical protein